MLSCLWGTGGAGTRTRASKEVQVHAQIDRNHETAQDELIVSSEAGGIEDRKDVVFDESAGITGLTGADPERVLQRRQWTDPASELDLNSP